MARKKKTNYIGETLDKIYEENKKMRGFVIDTYDGKDIYNHMTKEKSLYAKEGIMSESMFTDKLMKNCKEFTYTKKNDVYVTDDFLFLNFFYKQEDEYTDTKKKLKRANEEQAKAKEFIGQLKKDIATIEKEIKVLETERKRKYASRDRAKNDDIKAMVSKDIDKITKDIRDKRKIKDGLKSNLERQQKSLSYNSTEGKKLAEKLANTTKGEGKTMSQDAIRKELYTKGIKITKEDGVYYYKNISQTSSKSRVGKTLWALDRVEDREGKVIRKGVYHAKEIDSLGIWHEAVESGEKFDIASYDAYNSLTQSAITDGYMKIDPDKILVIDDLDAEINCKAVVESLDKNGNVVINNVDDYVTKNTLFDGMCLVSDEVWEGNSSFALLRNDMFKSGASKVNMRGLLKARCDKYGIDYETATVTDKYGNKLRIKDIQMITTNNSTKFDKFADNEAELFARWKAEVKANDNCFAIVKTEHASKFGDVQQLSYQVFNSYDLADNIDEAKEAIREIAEYDINYINNMKNDNSVFLKYLEKTANDMNNNAMILGLCNHNAKYMNTKEYKDAKSKIISGYKKKAQQEGKIKMIGDNLILVGDPILLTDHALGQAPTKKGTKGQLVLDKEKYDNELFSNKSVGKNKIYTTKFGHRENTVMSRSPHCGDFSLVCGYNTYDVNNVSELEKYLYVNDNIAIVDMTEYAFQDMTAGLI